MAEAKQELIKKIKATTAEFGDLLKAENWDDAFEAGRKLNDLLKSEETDNLTKKEMDSLHFDEIKNQLKKYWFINGEFRKCRGALLKKGDKFLELSN